MGKHSGLLFGGTVIKEANSDGDFKWFSLSPRKYKGHWAYLEFVDRGTDAYLEIDRSQVCQLRNWKKARFQVFSFAGG